MWLALAPHSAPKHPVKSQPLSVRAARIADRIATVHRRSESGPWRFDAKAAQRTLDTGIAQPRPELTLAHLDLRAPHILTHQGSLVGIIDWGDAAAGDPATDIGHALATLPHSHWDALVQGYGGLSLSDFQRARAEALDMASWLALSHDPVEARSGWAALQSLGLAKTV